MICAVATLALVSVVDGYKTEVDQWRAQREAELKSENNWLSVSGLYWLKDGDTTIGTAPNSGILLPAGSAPAMLGTISFADGRVTFKAAVGASVTRDGNPVTTTSLDGGTLQSGALTFTVIRRGNRTGIRLYDNNSPGRRNFTGEKWFPVDPKYRIEAKFVPYDKPKEMPITDVLGDTAPVPNPGYVLFSIGGRPCRLEAEAQGGGLFFNFRDATTGRSTYPAGRFLDAPAPKDGHVVLDFNKAVNPPCAFTAFATCPLPPRSNFLTVEILAGEKTYHVHE